MKSENLVPRIRTWFNRSLRTYRQIKQSAGWHNLSIAGTVTTGLALVSDLSRPYFYFVKWGLIAAIGVLIVCLVTLPRVTRRTAIRQKERTHARALLSSFVGTVVFGILFVANSAVPGERGVLAGTSDLAAGLQDRLFTIERSLEDVGESLEQIGNTTAEILEESRQTNEELERANEQLSQSNEALESIDQTTEETRKSIEDLSSAMALDTAMTIMDRAMEHRDLSQRGQNLALGKLLSIGQNFSNSDLSGIHLGNTDFQGQPFRKTKFKFSDLTSVSAARVDFSDARFDFATYPSAKFDDATFGGAFLPFSTGQRASFKGATLHGANFLASDLRGADFSDADLHGASFMFADLRGADLRNANLEGAFLIGALLDGAKIDGARFEKTDISGAVFGGTRMTAGQRTGTCATPAEPHHSVRFRIIEQIPNTRFSGGIENHVLIEMALYTKGFSKNNVLPCNVHWPYPMYSPPIWEFQSKSLLRQEFAFAFETAFLSKGDHRATLMRRIERHSKDMAAVLDSGVAERRQ